MKKHDESDFSLQADLDPNPIRVIFSICDWLRNIFVLNLPYYDGIPGHWGLAFFCLGFWIMVLSYPFPGGIFWIFFLVCVLLTPFSVYLLVRIIWRPVPFFSFSIKRRDIPEGVLNVVGFGRILLKENSKTFLKGEDIVVRNKWTFSWNRGRIKVNQNILRLDLDIKAAKYRGKIECPFKLELEFSADMLGEATFLWKRVPALQFVYEGENITILVIT